MKTKISISIDERKIREIDSVIDNVYIRNRSQAIEYLLDQSLSIKKTAVILSGGTVDSLRISKDEFRPTAKIGKRYLIELTMEKLHENGFRDIYVIARGEILTKIFDIIKDGSEYGVKVQYVEEKKSSGTLESLKYISSKIRSHFLVVYGDLYFKNVNIDEIWNHHLRHNPVATIMMTTSSKPSEKGTLKVEGSKVLEFTQKPSGSDIYLVFSPIFVCEASILNYPGKSIETDVFPIIAKKGLLEGHLSSEKEIHIHTKNDIKLI
jgi:NDP-sugar pyrophosphorylase family protein